MCTAVLHHHLAVAVIDIHQREGLLVEAVEEQFLSLDILGIGAVIVQMIVREVCEKRPTELQSSYAILHQRVRRHLHKAVVATAIHHLAQHGVKTYGVGCGVCRGDLASVDAIDHRRNQSCTVAHTAIEVVEQRGDGCLAVGARNTHQMQLARGVVVVGCRHIGHSLIRISHHNVAYAIALFLGLLLAHYGYGTSLNGTRDVVVAVALRASHSKETVTLCGGARVVGKTRYRVILSGRERYDLGRGEYFA